MYRILDDAARDIEETFVWYEQQQPGLGVRFLAELERVWEIIDEYPALYAMIYKTVRKAKPATFPYQIYYFIKGEEQLVLAVLHERRKPSVWQNRFDDELQ